MASSYSAFLHAAAAAYRATGVAEAVAVAERLEGHAGRAFALAPGAPPAAAHLAAALAATDAHPALASLGPAIHNLGWTEGELPVPQSFRHRYAYAVLVGPEGPLIDAAMYYGLYVQAPNSTYPKHWHMAEELYFVLSGTADWQQGDGPLLPKPPGSLIHHRPNEPHVIQTFSPPLVAMWAWIGDLRDGTYRIVED